MITLSTSSPPVLWHEMSVSYGPVVTVHCFLVVSRPRAPAHVHTLDTSHTAHTLHTVHTLTHKKGVSLESRYEGTKIFTPCPQKIGFGAQKRPNLAQNWHFGPNIGIFGPFDLMPDQKTMGTSCLSGFLLCWYQNSCHEGLEHTFIDDPPSTNGILLLTGNGNKGPDKKCPRMHHRGLTHWDMIMVSQRISTMEISGWDGFRASSRANKNIW